MEEKTLKALKASIAKWEAKAKAKSINQFGVGAKGCPLCSLFNKPNMNTQLSCVGCPVFAKTGKLWCAGTPQEDAEGIRNEWLIYGPSEYRHIAHEIARKEVAFLRSLLPEGEAS